MPIFEAIGEILRGLTVNENADQMMSEKEAEKEAEEIVMKYNKGIEEKEKEVSNVRIPLGDEESTSFVPHAQVSETLADKTAKEKVAEKGREQEEDQIGK